MRSAPNPYRYEDAPECPATFGEHCPEEHVAFGPAGQELQIIVCAECGEELCEVRLRVPW